MGEKYETRFGFIYATFTTAGQRQGDAFVTVHIDDATRRPHTWATFLVHIAGETTEALTLALTAATERMGREYGVIGMTWNPIYTGWKGVQWHPDTFQPVNGRVTADSIRTPAVPRRRHARTA